MIDIDPDLLSFLKQEYSNCLDSTLEDERETAIDRYNGEPYGDEEDGRSQVVSRDTAETVDYMVISIMRTLVGGDRIVEFQHKNREKAHEATETIMYLLMGKQDGYRILHDWLKAGLLEKNAVAMTYGEKPQPKRVKGKVPKIMLGDDERIIEAEESGETDPFTGEPIMDVVALIEQQPEFCDAAIPNEEFYCSLDARTLDEAALKGRRVRKTLSDLVAMGFDKDDVENIGPGAGYQDGLSIARDEDRISGTFDRMGMARVIWWHEEYVRFDANGDGIAELLYVQRSADWHVFNVEEVDEDEGDPFVDWCPFPMQHRRIGQSLADKVMDIERIRTVLMRQSLDGIYLGNNPSTYVHEDAIGENTIEDLLTVRPGRLVRWKGGVAPAERQSRFDPSAGFQMLEFMNRERETRTGITRLNMGLDEDTLNQTAKGQAQLIARGEQVEEYIARNFANAVARLITKKARLLQRYGEPLLVPVDGEFREVDPREWPEDMVATARVGLGASRKDQRLAFTREMIQMQAAAMQGGLGIVTEQNMFNSAKAFVADAGLGDVKEYFTEPPKGPDGQPLPKQEQPDPEMAKAQAQLQMQGQKAQMDAMAKQQAAQVNAQLKREEMQMDAGLEMQRMGMEAQLEREQMALKAATGAQQEATQPGGDLSK